MQHPGSLFTRIRSKLWSFFRTAFLQVAILPFILLVLLISEAHGQTAGNSWVETRDLGSGTLVVAYSENSPFVYVDERGELGGIEIEIIKEFARFIERRDHVEVEIVWEHLSTFDALLDTLKTTDRHLLGIASISTLEERRKFFNISKVYMPDIEVVVSSGEFRSVGNLGEFARMVKENTAITVVSSTFERNILELKKDYFPEINMRYVPHVDVLIEEISNADNLWGYISLPNYLSYLRSGKDISRHRFFMVENPGISVASPLASDWVEAFDMFIEDPSFQPLIDRLIERQLGSAFSNVVRQISEQKSDSAGVTGIDPEVGVLTLERELQDLKLRQNELEIERKNLIIYISVAGIILVLVVLIVLYRLIRLKSITNKSLSEKNTLIEEQNKELIALNEEKNELLGIMAHDLKNPLTSALSVSELFAQEEITADQQEYVDLIHKSLDRMNSLVSKILEIKVLESTELQLKYSEVDLKLEILRVVENLKVHSQHKRISISTELESVKGQLDGSLFIQVLDNLVSNALKFSEKNTRIIIKLKLTDVGARIEVKDQGPGISSEDMPKLFRKFQKLKAKPTGGESSTGLGLSIVKKYVESMNGSVWCESVPGHGSTFIVEFIGDFSD